MSGWLLVPLGLVAWACVHASGVHATIAGVALGLVVPGTVVATQRALRLPEPPEESLAERWEHAWRPLSGGRRRAGVRACSPPASRSRRGSLRDAFADPVAQGVALGLVVGKPLGIFGATYLVARFTHASLAPGLGWGDVAAVGLLGGIGFTVSLLVGELAFGRRQRARRARRRRDHRGVRRRGRARRRSRSCSATGTTHARPPTPASG